MRRSLVCVLSVLALALAIPLMAQTEKSISGKVVSSTSDRLVIQTDDGRQMTFNVDAQSTVPASIMSGNRVTVRYHELAGGTFHAANVNVTDTGTATPPRGTTTETTTTTERTETATDEPRETRTMPATASPLPLIGLAGLLSLGAGLGVRALRRRA